MMSSFGMHCLASVGCREKECETMMGVAGHCADVSFDFVHLFVDILLKSVRYHSAVRISPPVVIVRLIVVV
jgi:hypothetical protein